ncbi:MAG: hypothetical protein JWM59_2179 [Verrucomicrobiales bacterium]|nr:hypothetical protein [Verrucomicrobiales bacterium]
MNSPRRAPLSPSPSFKPDPGLRRLRGGPLPRLHSGRENPGFRACGTAAAQHRRAGHGILRPEALTGLDVTDKGLAVRLQGAQKGRIPPVSRIGADPLKLNAPRPLGADHFQKDHRFGFEGPGGFGDFGFGAARGVPAPCLRQVKAALQKRGAAARGQRHEDARLTVVHLAQAAVVLPGHAGRAGPFFTECAFIPYQTAHGGSAQQAVGPAADLGKHFAIVPGRVGNEMLHPLMVAARNGFGDVLKIAVPGFGLHQAAQINARLHGGGGGPGRGATAIGVPVRSGAGPLEPASGDRTLKKFGDTADKSHEASAQREVGRRVIFY